VYSGHIVFIGKGARSSASLCLMELC
jgi:hypothetical protein